MKRLKALGVVMLAVAIPAMAQMGRYSLKFNPTRTDFVDSIAVSLDDGRVFLPVEIGGMTYRFMLDTGSGQTTIFSTTKIDGLAEAGNIISHDAANNIDTVKMVKLPTVTIGSVDFTGMQAVVMKKPSNWGGGLDGLLGFDIVCRGFQMKIDVSRSLLIITDRNGFFDKERGIDLKYKTVLHVPHVTVNPFAGFAEDVFFDTGNSRLFDLNRSSFDAAEKKYGSAVARQTEGRNAGRHRSGLLGSESSGDVVFLSLDSLMLGNFALRDVHSLTTQAQSSLGAALLSYGSVVFLPKKKILRFIPYTDGGVHVGNKQLELAFVSEGKRLVVGLVWPGGRAYKLGFRVGDVLKKKYPDGTHILTGTDGITKTIVWKPDAP